MTEEWNGYRYITEKANNGLHARKEPEVAENREVTRRDRNSVTDRNGHSLTHLLSSSVNERRR